MLSKLGNLTRFGDNVLQIYGAGFVRNIVVGEKYMGEGLSKEREYHK